MRRIPPTRCNPGISRSHTTAKVAAARMIMAPNVPQIMARFCWFFGKFLAANPMTIALSPAKTRSITTIASRAEKTLLKTIP